MTTDPILGPKITRGYPPQGGTGAVTPAEPHRYFGAIAVSDNIDGLLAQLAELAGIKRSEKP